LGWFHATPKSSDDLKQKEGQKKLTRAEKITARGGTPLFPKIGEESYLLQIWFDLGMVGSGAMGAIQLSAQEITAWSNLSGVELEPWEFACIRKMSAAYLRHLNEGENPESLPPYGDPINEFDRNVVEKKVVNAFKAFLQARKR
jgi:hypothetical protein